MSDLTLEDLESAPKFQALGPHDKRVVGQKWLEQSDHYQALGPQDRAHVSNVLYARYPDQSPSSATPAQPVVAGASAIPQGASVVTPFAGRQALPTFVPTSTPYAGPYSGPDYAAAAQARMPVTQYEAQQPRTQPLVTATPTLTQQQARARTAANIANIAAELGTTPAAARAQGVPQAVAAGQQQRQAADVQTVLNAQRQEQQRAGLVGGGAGVYRTPVQAQRQKQAQVQGAATAVNVAPAQSRLGQNTSVLDTLVPGSTQAAAQMKGVRGGLAQLTVGLINSLPDIVVASVAGGATGLQGLVGKYFAAQMAKGTLDTVLDSPLRKSDPTKWATLVAGNALLTFAPHALEKFNEAAMKGKATEVTPPAETRTTAQQQADSMGATSKVAGVKPTVAQLQSDEAARTTQANAEPAQRRQQAATPPAEAQPVQTAQQPPRPAEVPTVKPQGQEATAAQPVRSGDTLTHPDGGRYTVVTADRSGVYATGEGHDRFWTPAQFERETGRGVVAATPNTPAAETPNKPAGTPNVTPPVTVQPAGVETAGAGEGGGAKPAPVAPKPDIAAIAAAEKARAEEGIQAKTAQPAPAVQAEPAKVAEPTVTPRPAPVVPGTRPDLAQPGTGPTRTRPGAEEPTPTQEKLAAQRQTPIAEAHPQTAAVSIPEPWQMSKAEYVAAHIDDAMKTPGPIRLNKGASPSTYERAVRDAATDTLTQQYQDIVKQAMAEGKPVPAGNRPAWALTQAEYLAHSLAGMREVGNPDAEKPSMKAADIADHRQSVEFALQDKAPVPPHVIADYPDLAKEYGRWEPYQSQETGKWFVKNNVTGDTGMISGKESINGDNAPLRYASDEQRAMHRAAELNTRKEVLDSGGSHAEAVKAGQTAGMQAVYKTGKSAADWAQEMADLRAVKPRPIAKMFGTKGPTPEQAAAHADAMKRWNAQYRKASQNQKFETTAASDLRARLAATKAQAEAGIKSKAGQLNAGLDPELLADYARYGAAHLLEKGLDFADWSKHMLEQFPALVDHLKEVWAASVDRYHSQFADKFNLPRVPTQGGTSSAVQVESPSRVLPREQGETGIGGSQRLGVGRGNEGQASPRTGEAQATGPARAEEGRTQEAQAGEVKPTPLTGAKNATTEAERTIRGLAPEVDKQTYTSIRDAYLQGQQAVDAQPTDPNKINPARLAQEVASKPRPLTAVEVGALTYDRAGLITQTNDLTAKINDAIKSGAPQGEIDKLRSDRATALDHYLINDEALQKGGREQAAAFNARKMMVNADYTYAGVQARMRAEKGGALTDKEDAQITQLTAALEKNKADLSAKTAEIATHQETIKNLQARLETSKTAQGVKARNAKSADILTQRQQILDRLNKSIADFKSGRGGGGGTTAQKARRGFADFGQDAGPGSLQEMTGILRDLFRNHVEGMMNGVGGVVDRITHGDVIDRVHADLVAAGIDQFSKRDVRDAISGYGKDVTPRDRTEAQKMVSDLTRQMKLVSGIEDVGAGTQPWQGQPIPQASPEVKDLRNQLNKAMIDAGMKSPPDRLQARIDAAGKTLDTIQARIDHIQQTGTDLPPAQKASAPSTPELDDLRQQIKDARAVLKGILPEDARNAQPLKAYKTRLQKQIDDYTQRLATGNFEFPRRPETKLDQDARDLQKQRNDLKFKIDQTVAAAKKPTIGDKILGVQRFNLLTRVSTLGKLATAAIARTHLSTPAEEAMGTILTHLPGQQWIRDVAAKAPREGSGFKLSEQLHALQTFWGAVPNVEVGKTGVTLRAMAPEVNPSTFGNPKAKISGDVRAKLATGETSLAKAYGQKTRPAHGVISPNGPYPSVEAPAAVHGAFKTPAQRAEFFLSLEKRGKFEAAKGKDITDPATALQIGMDAYTDSLRAIFMNPNKLSSAFTNAAAGLDRAGAPGLATAVRGAVPIRGVPTNFAGERGLHVGGAFAALDTIRKAGKSATAEELKAAGVDPDTFTKSVIQRGLKTLTPEEADVVMRSLKKQGVGAALMSLGFLGYQGIKVGGFYTGDRKHPPKPGDLKPGEMQIFGMNVPHALAHIPMLGALQVAKTIRDSFDNANGGVLQKLGTAATTGVGNAAWGLAEDVPFMDTAARLGKSVETPEGRAVLWANLLKGAIEPGGMQEAAQFWDKDAFGNPIRREEKDAGEVLKTGVPGLRRTVPVKGSGKKEPMDPMEREMNRQIRLPAMTR